MKSALPVRTDAQLDVLPSRNRSFHIRQLELSRTLTSRSTVLSAVDTQLPTLDRHAHHYWTWILRQPACWRAGGADARGCGS